MCVCGVVWCGVCVCVQKKKVFCGSIYREPALDVRYNTHWIVCILIECNSCRNLAVD